MTHSDDLGLVLPPKLAPVHVAVVPIFNNSEQLDQIKEKLKTELEQTETAGFND